MAGFSVTPEDVQNASKQALTANSQVEDILHTLKGQIDSLQSVWAGVAHENFDGLFLEWNEGAAKLQDALTQIAAKLQTASQVYAETESNIASTFRS